LSQAYLADFDYYGHPELESEGELLELTRIEANRILYLLGPKAGKVAVIKRSVHGFHLSLPYARLTQEEVLWINEGSPSDTGFKWWVQERGSSTLRLGPKTIMVETGEGPHRRFVGRRQVKDTPFIVEIIKNRRT